MSELWSIYILVVIWETVTWKEEQGNSTRGKKSFLTQIGKKSFLPLETYEIPPKNNGPKPDFA